MRLPLERQKPHAWGPPPISVWRDSPPFVMNDQGLLIHRPRTVTARSLPKKAAWLSIRYWCGNQVNGRKNLTFITDPADRLLCEACEARAVMAGLPAARTITGKHVHIGKLKAVRICCPDLEAEDA